MRRWPACALAVVALAGCGGGGGPSRAEFAARAEAICGDVVRTTAPLQRQVREAARLREPALVFRRTALLHRRLAAAEARAADIIDATPHPEDDDEVRQWLAALRRARASREQLADAYGAGDLGLIARSAAATDRRQQRADALARRVGTPACAALA
jgi:hypothetical protein